MKILAGIVFFTVLCSLSLAQGGDGGGTGASCVEPQIIRIWRGLPKYVQQTLAGQGNPGATLTEAELSTLVKIHEFLKTDTRSPLQALRFESDSTEFHKREACNDLRMAYVDLSEPGTPIHLNRKSFYVDIGAEQLAVPPPNSTDNKKTFHLIVGLTTRTLAKELVHQVGHLAGEKNHLHLEDVGSAVAIITETQIKSENEKILSQLAGQDEEDDIRNVTKKVVQEIGGIALAEDRIDISEFAEKAPKEITGALLPHSLEASRGILLYFVAENTNQMLQVLATPLLPELKLGLLDFARSFSPFQVQVTSLGYGLLEAQKDRATLRPVVISQADTLLIDDIRVTSKQPDWQKYSIRGTVRLNANGQLSIEDAHGDRTYIEISSPEFRAALQEVLRKDGPQKVIVYSLSPIIKETPITEIATYVVGFDE